MRSEQTDGTSQVFGRGRRRSASAAALTFAGFAALASTLVLVSVSPAAARPPAGVTCGETITTDVTLTANLVCPSGAGLILEGPVTVDFAGHTLSGAGTGASGVETGGNGYSQLLNGTISGFTALGVDGATTLRNMRITHNGGGVSGVFSGLPGSSSLLTIDDSSITSNAGDGVHGYFTLIHGSTIARNGGYGVYTVQGLRMFDSVVSGNTQHDVEVQTGGLFLLDNGVYLTGNTLRNTSIFIFTPYEDTVYLAHNRFINTSFTNEGGVLVDGGGNTGNSCPAGILCGR